MQRALFAVLHAAPALAGCAVHDSVPADAVPPYLTLGSDVVTDWSSKSAVGHEHRVQLTLWDQGPGSAGAKTLLAAIEAAVRPLGGTTDGHRIASVVFLRSFTTKAADGWTQGIAEFRIRTQQL